VLHPVLQTQNEERNTTAHDLQTHLHFAIARLRSLILGDLHPTALWLRCITSKKGVELLKEIHSGFCGAHIGTRAIAGKAIKQGFFWSSINLDEKKLVQECEACQKKQRINIIYHPCQFT
jgi:hypothetical protein